MVDNNAEIQRKLEEAKPLLKGRRREVEDILNHPALRAGRPLLEEELRSIQEMERFAEYLEGGTSLEELMKSPRDRLGRPNGVDSRPVPGRVGSNLGERVIGFRESY